MNTALEPSIRSATVHCPLSAGPHAARAARHSAARILTSRPAQCPHGAAEDILLIVSELATNAVRHARPPYALTLSLESGRADIALSDASPGLPRRHDPGTVLTTRGRGLQIIHALGAELFVSTSPHGHQVIAVITWPAH
ncbi:ATP-binding protein [Streptomyces sp. NPDC088748]|uniref:ATP-binding protein n=1 Tax=Streptomyces sp. NPDC088748 TaxID=3365887 RepID=UPI0038167732